MMNFRDYLKERLKSYAPTDIIITDHAYIRMIQRQINKEEVIRNIVDPFRLEYALKDKDRFDCYFKYSNTLCHRYVLIPRKKVLVITVIKINRRWQRIVEGKMKK